MEYIFEFILELIFEGSIEASKSKKVPKPIRYILITLIALFFLAVIGLIFLTGILCLEKNIAIGIFFILIGIITLVASIVKFKQTYVERKNTNE